MLTKWNKRQKVQTDVSRSYRGLLKRLFEEEFGEIYDGTVIVKSIACVSGDCSKISVFSENNDMSLVMCR